MTNATAIDWGRFLRPVAASVRNPPTGDDFKGRCAALAFALRIPAHALTEARQRELCRTSEFWPSVADIEALFAAHWRDAARTRAIASAGSATLLTHNQQPLTPEQRAELATKAAALVAELRALHPDTHKPKPRPSHLNPHHLTEARRRLRNTPTQDPNA
jgi:hypothetical protein